jgi:hypothetical protein
MLNLKRKALATFSIGLLGLSLVSCKDKRAKDDVTILGLDNEGRSVIRFLPKSRYVRRFNKMLGNLHGETTNQLENFVFDGNWDLKRVTVGLLVVGEAKLTDHFKLEVEPSFELRFQPLPKI